jgi:hypothetical protein
MEPTRTYLPEDELKIAASDCGVMMRLMARCLAETAKLERSSRTARQSQPLRDKLKENLPPSSDVLLALARRNVRSTAHFPTKATCYALAVLTTEVFQPSRNPRVPEALLPSLPAWHLATK